MGQEQIEHIVLVMMENRSFDHLLGWLPGADGTQAGLTYLDRVGLPHSTHPLAPDYQGCGHAVPNRMYQHAAQTDRLRNTFEPSTLPTNEYHLWPLVSPTARGFCASVNCNGLTERRLAVR